MKRKVGLGAVCVLAVVWGVRAALSQPERVGQNQAAASVSRRGDDGGQLAPATGISWDRSTLRWVQSGTYGRMVRLHDGALLCSYEAQGKSWVTRSRDEGRTWESPRLVRALTGASAANPELLQLSNGRLWLFYNQRPRDGVQPFAIGACWSDDAGATWQPRPTPLYTASTDFKDGCWEPAALQLPSGEIQLFFANEALYTRSDEQEITLLRSLDEGASWGKPQTVAFRAGHRDGMPVPLLLRDGGDVVFVIEDNGLAPGTQLQPAIIRTTRAANWRQPVVMGSSAQRENALAMPLPPQVYAGAPYLRQLPSGETLLSCQSTEGGGMEGGDTRGIRTKPQMVVYIGDSQARHFAHRSVPVELPGDVAGSWNSLFVKNSRTITALTATRINGRNGLWAIDGYVTRSRMTDDR